MVTISTLFTAGDELGDSQERRSKRGGAFPVVHATHPFVLVLNLKSSEVDDLAVLGKVAFPSGSSAQQ